MTSNPNLVRKGTIGGVNFISVFNPVFICTLTAYIMDSRLPLFPRHIYNVLFVAAVYALPLLTNSAPAQYLTNVFAVRNVLVFTMIGEVFVNILLALLLLTGTEWGLWGVFGCIFLSGCGFTFYHPALKVYASEMLRRSELSGAVATAEATTFAGIFSGVILAVLAVRFIPAPDAAGLVTIFTAALGVALATGFPTDVAKHATVNVRQLHRQWLDGFRRHNRFRELLLTGIGESYVFASIILVASLAIQYIAVSFTGNFKSEFNLYFIIGSPVIGAILGSIAAGRRSKSNVEIGLVPGAVLGMTLAALLLGTLPMWADAMFRSTLMALLLFIFGFSAGMTLVPMAAYQEYFVKKELAPAFFSWFYLPFGLGIMLTIGLSLAVCRFDIPILTTAAVLAVLTLLLAAVTFYFMPQFLLRMLMLLLTKTLYKLSIFNSERIPEEGPALLVGNRASFVDIFFISACTSRPIRFMMHKSYYDVPILKPLFRSVGFIRVSSSPGQLRRLVKETRELLRAGELVCIFPEDDITRNGSMSAFRNGIGQMLPEDVDVPVLPVRLGMTWGSIFSCYYGKFTLRWPNELPHPASVTVGEPMPKNISGYEILVRLSELAAETELIPSPGERPFHSQFAFLAKKYPLARRISQFDGERTIAPRNITLLLRSIHLSRYLRAKCASDGEYIGIMLPNSLDNFCSVQAVLMADRKPAMINYTASGDSYRHALGIAGIGHVLTSRSFLRKINREPGPEMLFIEDAREYVRRMSSRRFWTFAAFILPAVELIKQVSPVSWHDVNTTAVLIFSSGSTGLPKGIMLSHHNINADISAIMATLGWTKNDRILGNLPYFHSFGFTVCLWLPVITGAKVTIIPNPLDGAAAMEAVRKDALTVMAATPGFLQLYMRRSRREDYASLRVVITGAEKLRDDVAERFQELSGLAIAEGYGCTELSPVVSINIANSRLELGVEVAERGSIGPPLAGICAKIVDPSTFELRPENADGLLLVKGATVMQGYINEPEKTAEVIRDGWYVTGDIGKMNRNGFITLTGRLSRFSKIAGEMVPHELVEREINSLLRPEDRLLAVCGAPDAARGEKLMVFYNDRGRVAPGSIVRQLREKGIPNLWIPKPENFIFLEHLPVLGSGKLDLAALHKIASAFGD